VAFDSTISKRILVVDDEPSILFALEDFFSSRGYQVDCADALEEALTLLAHNAYRLMIADLRLEGARGTQGLELAAFARSASPAVRIIVLTAYGTPDVEARARNLGADAFLHKPMPLPELARIVDTLLTASG
jgi:two-component system NtrC family response regulator